MFWIIKSMRHVFKVRSSLKLPPIACTVRERTCAGSYMCSLANVCHFVAGRSFLFYVKKDWITVRAAINNPTSFEVHAVIWFSLARNNNAAEIHGQLCEVYGLNVMSDSKVRHWCHLFKEGRMNVHGEERSGRPSVITDNLAEKVNTAIRGNRCFTISEMSLEFPWVSRSVIYNIVSEKLGYKKPCARWVPKMLTDEHKQKRLAAAHQFLQLHQIEGDQCFDHIVTGDEMWISYTNIESKRQSMQWRHSPSPKAKNFKQASSVSIFKLNNPRCVYINNRCGVSL